MNILLGVTGSVAAKLTPKLCRELMKVGNLKVIATEKSRYFFDYFTVEHILYGEPPDTCSYPREVRLHTEANEWTGSRYYTYQDISHITLGHWADIFVIAPLTANTLNKITLGLADNLLTCTYLAWNMDKPIVIAPAMNTNMWNHFTVQASLDRLHNRHNKWSKYSQRNSNTHRLEVIKPIAKTLACGDEGVGAMADIGEIIAAVKSMTGT